MKKIALLFTFMFFSFAGFAQLEKPITWSFIAKKSGKNEAVIFIKAKLDGKWHVYAQQIKAEAMKLKFNYAPSKDYTLVGKTTEPKPIKKYDKIVQMELAYFEKEVVFTQKIKLNKASTTVKAKVEFMVCNDKKCLPSDEVILNIPVK